MWTGALKSATALAVTIATSTATRAAPQGAPPAEPVNVLASLPEPVNKVTDLLNTALDHAALLIAAVVGLWWIMSRVKATYTLFRDFVGHELEDRLPGLLKRELQNGLGDLVELRMQKVLAVHEKEENARLDSAMRELRSLVQRESARRRRK